MLLVLDVGNTNTVLGVFARAAKTNASKDGDSNDSRYERLVANWRVATSATETVDEYGVLFRNLFAMDNLEVKGIHGIVISSVVPPWYSPLAVTQSNVVAVPKSTAITGPPYFSKAATEFTMRSAPTSAGFSYKTGIPVLIPGPTKSGLVLK